MRFFLDTEFIEDGRTIDLISVGIVTEDGREYYREVDGVDWSKANSWVLENVKPWLEGGSLLASKETIAEELVKFTQGYRPEFWAYYADYDWVVICQLFGTMMDLPNQWPKFCMDIKQLCVHAGNPRLPEQTSVQHHALADARWNLEVYNFLMERPPWEY